MNKELKKERQNFWDGWFKSCVNDQTCSIQKIIYDRDKEFIDRAVGRVAFAKYGSTKGTAAFMDRERLERIEEARK